MRSWRPWLIVPLAAASVLFTHRAIAHPVGAASAAARDVPAAWWGAVQRDIARSEYAIVSDPGPGAQGLETYRAANRAQNFRTDFTPAGIRIVPRTAHRDDAPAWEWGMALTSWGRDGAMPAEPMAPAPLRLLGDRIEYPRGGILEWYVNDSRGLEQGFTIARRPQSHGTEASGSERVRLRLAVAGDLEAAPGADPRAIDFITADGARAIALDHLAVTDANGRELPAWFETDAGVSRTLSIVLRDDRAAYPITIDPLASSPAWTAEANQVDAHLGYSVATAGDVNGDGYSDVIVGAYQFDNGLSNEGRAFVYHGSAAGLSLVANWTAESDQAGAIYGYSVGTAGDVNGDGFSDVIVGAPYFANGQSQEGRAFVYYGSASGLSLTANWTAESDQSTGIFGHSVSTAGDVNGDGFSDVIVGADAYDNGQTDEGRAYVYHGSASGLSLTANWTAESDQASSFFGVSVATAGDVNGDGFGDVIVAASLFANGQSKEGRAFVFHGSAAGLSDTANWIRESNQANAEYGTSVATAGDVNGDGFSDVIVGAPFYDNGQSEEGRAFAYYGSAAGLSLTAGWTAESDQASAELGYEAAAAGDVNGDGYADVIVGVRLFNNGQTDEGQARVYFGSAAGLDSIADWTAENDQASSQFGHSVATAGDVNGDGFSDVIVGAPFLANGQSGEGGAYAYLGSAAGLSDSASWTAESGQAGAQLGFSVASAGDVNGDGYGDVIVGARFYSNGQSNEGRALIYHGSAAGLSLVANWTAESDQATAQFGWSVASAGDVNGDGFGDVIVGAPSFSNGQNNEGRAFVYHGSASGVSATPNWNAESNQVDASFGHTVAPAGDVNGDGYGDVIVGAPVFDHGQIDEGQVFVYYGSAAGLSLSANWTAEGDSTGAQFGFAATTAGDVNGDGFSDVIIGAYQFNGGQSDEGRAFVYYGSTAGPSPVANWTAESDQADAQFGYAVATAGDVNSDGFSDVIVGAPHFENGQVDEGRAFLYLGSMSGPSVIPNWTTESNQSGEMGAAVASAGDVNGDGYSDVIVGSFLYSHGQSHEGRAFVYHGSAVGLGASAWAGESDQVDANYGNAVASAGDVNGDGYGDVVVGSLFFTNGQLQEGRAFVYLGNQGACRRTQPRQQRTDAATTIAPGGSSDSQTQFRIRANMLSVYGRTRLQMENEVKPRGVRFDGMNTTPGGFFDIGSDGVIGFNRLVSGLGPGTVYHWRVRPKYDLVKTPFQRNGPWVHVPIQGWNEADLRTAGVPNVVVVNEFLARPAAGRAEFYEILNEGAQTVDLNGWILTVNGVPDTIRCSGSCNINLAPGAYYVDSSFTGGLLADHAGMILLRRTDGAILDQVAYGDSGGAPVQPPNPKSVTTARLPNGVDTDQDASDFNATSSTAAAPNTGTASVTTLGTSVFISRIYMHGTGSDAIELYNPLPQPLDFTGFLLTDGGDNVESTLGVPGTSIGVLQPQQKRWMRQGEAGSFDFDITYDTCLRLYAPGRVPIEYIGWKQVPAYDPDLCVSRTPTSSDGYHNGYDFTTSGGPQYLQFRSCDINNDRTGVTEPVPTLSFAGVAPTPSRSGDPALMIFSLPGAPGEPMRPVRILLFDIAGRHVQTLFEGPLRPGTHRIPFSRNGSPRRLAAGLYLARLEVGNQRLAKRVVIIP